MQFTAVPDMAGVSTLQRNPNPLFQKIKNRKTVFITQRGNPTAVLLNIEVYQNLIDAAHESEEFRILGMVKKGAQEALDGSNVEDFDTFLKSQ